jgi:peptidoglycan/xylan/chitin deacetylase (PgdA/CDA1 family)
MKPFTWPNGHRSAASLTFDFDAETVWVAMDPQNAKRPGVLSIGHYGARVGLPLILDVLKRHDVRATFFTVGQNVERYPDRVRRIVDEGHELAVHGYTHTPPQQLSADAEEEELIKALALLRGTGATISGYRSPSWDVSPATLDLLEKHGLSYSSQMMADIRPYRHPGKALVELPIQWLLDDWPFFAFGLGQMDRPIQSAASVEAVWTEELEAIHALGGHFVLTMHPQVIGRPSRVAMLDRMVAKLRARGDIWLATCAEVAAHAASTLAADDTVSLFGVDVNA